jgi:hypothetical protein
MLEARPDARTSIFIGKDGKSYDSRTMPTVPRPRASASAPPVPSGTGGRVARWQGYTLQANLAFEAGQNVRARQLYDEALTVADEVLDAAVMRDWDAARFGPLLFGSSCNNIVELARQRRDVETEGIFLYRAVERFIAVARLARAPLRLRSRCLLHLKVASDALYRYFERQGMWDAAASYTERANAAMFEVRRLEMDAKRRARAAAARGAKAVGRGAPQGRVDVVCSSSRDTSQRGSDGGAHDDVLRIIGHGTVPAPGGVAPSNQSE